jgi:hypothetical protein
LGQFTRIDLQKKFLYLTRSIMEKTNDFENNEMAHRKLPIFNSKLSRLNSAEPRKKLVLKPATSIVTESIPGVELTGFNKLKSLFGFMSMVALFVACSLQVPQYASAQQGNISFQVFYDELSPYGEWVDYPNYGYVWVPYVEQDFAPYSTRGHWVYTDYGWTWASDYQWGWAPFHYGRWFNDNYYGWLWLPDNEWGPSWVTWRSADGYFGWSPMGPNVSINLSFGRHHNPQNDHWVFVRDRDFGRSDVHRYRINRADHERIIGNSRIISNTYVDNRHNSTYISGPSRHDVQRTTGRNVKPVVIHETDQRRQTTGYGRINIYRPQVNRNDHNGQRPVPARVSNLQEIKGQSERVPKNQSQRVNSSSNNKNKQPAKPKTTNKKDDQKKGTKTIKGQKVN